jgi:hypothetical protein
MSLYLISSLVGHVALSKEFILKKCKSNIEKYEKAWDGIWGKTQSKSFTA